MITDKINNQIPSATRGRMQLVKPQQTMNSGSTNPISEKYNPILAKDQSGANANSSMAAKPTNADANAIRKPITPTVDEQGYNKAYGYATGIYDKESGEELFATPNYQGTGQSVIGTPYDYMRLRSMIAEAPDDDLYKILTDISNGTLKRNNMQTGATMTGDQYITNSNQDKFR